MPARLHQPLVVGHTASQRVWIIAGILALECLPATVGSHPWLQVRTFASAAIFFCVSLLFFGRDKLKAATWIAAPIDKTWALLHVSALAVFCTTNYLLVEVLRPGSALGRGTLSLWYVALLSLPITLGAASFHPRKLLHLLGSLGSAWGLAALSGVLVMSARSLMMMAWDAPDSRFGLAMRVATFRGVRALLGVFYANLQADPASSIIGTPNFLVEISGLCSGIEGLALMLTLTLGWLFYSRRELRLERALLLVPLSLAMTWMFNLVRIAGLIAIGDAGHPTIAFGGFHSHAGWIFFSCVALGFLLIVNGVAWFRQDGAGVLAAPVPQPSGRLLSATNTAAVYLLPLLAIVAAGLLAASASTEGFERWYGLRFIAALAVLYAYRREYRRLDWRFDWLGPAAGLAVFAMWIALDRWMNGAATGGAAASGVAIGLTQLSAGQRAVWIAVRTIAAVITVPVAEELAFRGYIARRLMSPDSDVESVPLRTLSVVAVLGSSVLFGALHGRMWLAGMLAGVVFAVVAKLRGRIGEAVAAHATANLAIAAWVLTRSDYSLW